jgi:SAM-dependent methyltransferase
MIQESRDRDLMPRVVAGEIRQHGIDGGARRAIDFGCGTGVLSFLLEGDLGVIYAVDTADEKMDHLEATLATREKSGADIRPLRIDLTKDPFPHGKVDLVFAMMSLHHVPDPFSLIGGFAEILEPGGRLCIADLEESGQPFHPSHMEHARDGFTRDELEETCRRYDLTPLRYEVVHRMLRVGPDGLEHSHPIFAFFAEKPGA